MTGGTSQARCLHGALHHSTIQRDNQTTPGTEIKALQLRYRVQELLPERLSGILQGLLTDLILITVLTMDLHGIRQSKSYPISNATVGTYNWQVPNAASTSALVRVTDAGNGDNNRYVSDANFTIEAADPYYAIDNIASTYSTLCTGNS